MQAVNNVAASVEQVANDLTIGDLGRALRAGLADFLARPLFGLFFASIYVAAGLFYAVTWNPQYGSILRDS